MTGGTLPRDAASYIRREADERLYSSLRQGHVCYALTPRQMGKSSLMVQTAARLRRRGASVALLDLTALGQNLTPDQWYNGLVGRIGQQLDLEDELESYWNAHLHMGPLQRWAGAIREVVLRARSGAVVIFIDEIDAVRSLPFSTDEFFAGIREFYNRRTQDPELARLTFCLLGVATPSDLIRDTRTTPFNVGVRVELSDFTLDEAAPLAQGLCTDAQKGQRLIRRILYWTGGHPYLTQRLCQAISQNCAASPADVDRKCGELFLSHRARERDDNLLFVRERMLRNDTDLAALLLLYGKICAGRRVRDDETNPFVTVLRLAGAIRVDRGYLRTRNRIYAEVFNKRWVAENLPGAEVRRQRSAYFRGFKIGGIVFAPFLLLGALLIYRDLNTNTPPPPALSDVKPTSFSDLKPPAFWASFTTQSRPASESGALLIKTGEADVSVLVNGVQYGRTEKGGVLRIPVLPPGDYRVRLEKPGFQAVSVDRTQVLAQRETRLNLRLSPMSVVVIESVLLVSQAPAGTRVTVDGKTAGTTNVDGSLSLKVEPGEHEITLDKANYLSRNFKSRLSPGTNIVDGKLQLDREAIETAAALQSNDPAKLQDFLEHYPNSKSVKQVREKMENLDWARLDHSDPTQLQRFIDKYPNGDHTTEASNESKQLQKDDMDWRSAQATNTMESLQDFVANHSRSRHLRDANNALSVLVDRAEIAQVLKAYQSSYNNHDVQQLLQVWPSCPSPQTLSELFRQKRSISLSPNGMPIIKGDIASLTVTIIKQTETGDSRLSVPFQFRKQNAHWIIEKGAL